MRSDVPSHLDQPPNAPAWLGRASGLLFLVVLALNVVFGWRRGVWGIRDEIAHYDYIERLSHWRMPAPGDPISERTYRLTMQGLSWNRPAGFDGSRKAMGLDGLSYEAQQPPLYYLVMAGPNRFLEFLDVAPFALVRTLRTVQLLLVAAGLLALVCAARELSELTGVDPVWGRLLAVALLVTNANWYSSLSNDNFSVPVGCLFTWLLIRAGRTASPRAALIAGAVAAAGVLVKLTNAILILPLAIVVLRRRRQTGLRIRQVLPPLLLPLGALAVWGGLGVIRFGDPTGQGAVRNYFAPWVRPLDTVDLTRYLVADAMNIRHIGFSWPPALVWAAALAIPAHALVRIRRLVSSGSPSDGVALLSAAVALSVLLSATYLNLLEPGVHWHTFRHYAATLPFWYAALLGWPVGAAGRSVAPWVAFGLLATLGLAYACRMLTG